MRWVQNSIDRLLTLITEEEREYILSNLQSSSEQNELTEKLSTIITLREQLDTSDEYY